MALIDLSCPNCHGDIKLDDSTGFGYCMYCGHKVFLQEKSVNKVVIDDSSKLENYRNLAKKLMSGGNSDEIRSISLKILELCPDDWYAWYCRGCAAAIDLNTDEALDSWVHSVNNITSPEDYDETYPDLLVNISSLFRGLLDSEDGDFSRLYNLAYALDDKNNEFDREYDIFTDLLDYAESLFDVLTEKHYCAIAIYASSVGFAAMSFYVDPRYMCEFSDRICEICDSSLKYANKLTFNEDKKLDRYVDSVIISELRLVYDAFSDTVPGYFDEISEEEADELVDAWAEADINEYKQYFFEAYNKGNFDDRPSKLKKMSIRKSMSKDIRMMMEVYLEGPDQ